MISNSVILITRIASLSKSKKEFDIIPHLDGPNHKEILETDDAFALCSCLSGEVLWRPTYRLALKSTAPPSIEWLTFLLLFSPSCLTFWHRRKQLVVDQKLSISDELSITRLILSRFPRSTETLQHRHWVLNRLSSEEFESLFSEEVEFCELLGDKHRCNYMVWQHRRWLLEKMGVSSKLLQSELGKMDEWNFQHPLDISGWCYRAFLLRLCQKAFKKGDFEQILITEIKRVLTGLDKTPEVDALWWYREQIAQIFLESFGDLAKLKELDPSIQICPELRNLADMELKLENNVSIPSEYRLAWAAFLYKRYLRWLSQIVESKEGC
ncbi:hypothetical protein Aperf_G00000108304 [Anoplocephala perfoliata]